MKAKKISLEVEEDHLWDGAIDEKIACLNQSLSLKLSK